MPSNLLPPIGNMIYTLKANKRLINPLKNLDVAIARAFAPFPSTNLTNVTKENGALTKRPVF